MKAYFNQRFLIGGGIGLLLVLWFLSGLLTREPPQTPKSPELIKVAVRTFKSVSRMSELVIRGHTEANRRVTLRAEVAGPIAGLKVSKGARVQAQEEILFIDPEERREMLKQSQAFLEQRRLQFDAVSKLRMKKFRSETQFAESEALLRIAEAGLARINTAMKNTHIIAPFAGVLADRYVEVGDYVVDGDKVALIVELNPLKVVASAAEQDINRIKLGTQSRIRMASGEEVEGKVTFVSSVANPNTRTFVVELVFANPNYAIRDGLTAEVYIPVKQVMAHRISPAILALNDQGQVGVKSVNANSVVEFHVVTIVGHDGEGIWVAGLPNTIRLVVTGQDYISQGQKVIAVDQ